MVEWQTTVGGFHKIGKDGMVRFLPSFVEDVHNGLRVLGMSYWKSVEGPFYRREMGGLMGFGEAFVNCESDGEVFLDFFLVVGCGVGLVTIFMTRDLVMEDEIG